MWLELLESFGASLESDAAAVGRQVPEVLIGGQMMVDEDPSLCQRVAESCQSMSEGDWKS